MHNYHVNHVYYFNCACYWLQCNGPSFSMHACNDWLIEWLEWVCVFTFHWYASSMHDLILKTFQQISSFSFSLSLYALSFFCSRFFSMAKSIPLKVCMFHSVSCCVNVIQKWVLLSLMLLLLLLFKVWKCIWTVHVLLCLFLKGWTHISKKLSLNGFVCLLFCFHP